MVSGRVGGVVQQLVEPALHVLDVRDVDELDGAVRGGVADDQRAAPEHPVDEAELVGDVAHPGERDVVAPAGDHAHPGDQAPVGDGVRRGQPDHERAHDEPDEHERGEDPDDQGGDRRCRPSGRRSRPPPASGSARAARRTGPWGACGC